MIGKDSFCANSFECMKTIKGEEIVRVVQAEKGYVFIFKSGYSLTIRQAEFMGETMGFACFWINDKEKTKSIIEEIKHRIKLLE